MTHEIEASSRGSVSSILTPLKYSTPESRRGILPDPSFAPDQSFTSGPIGPIRRLMGPELGKLFNKPLILEQVLYEIEMDFPWQRNWQIRCDFARQWHEAVRRFGASYQTFNTMKFIAQLRAYKELQRQYHDAHPKTTKPPAVDEADG